MPRFEVQGPDGKRYEIEAPDEASALAVFDAPQQQQAPAPAQSGGGLVQGATDILRRFNSGLTLGGYDKLVGTLTGSTPEVERAKTEAARQRTGIAGGVAELGGMLLPSSMVAKGVAAGAGALSAVPALGRVAASPFTQAAATGAITGGTEAAMKDQPIGQGAGIGAASGLLGQGLASGLMAGAGKVAGLANKKPNIPSGEEIRRMKDAAYQQADNSGVVYTPEFVSRIAQEAQSKAVNLGYSPRLQQGAKGVLEEIGDRSGKNITMQDADILRRIASAGYKPGEKSNNAVVRGIVETIDDAIAKPRPQDVLMGNAAQGAAALKQARELAARDFKLQDVQQAVSRAQTRAGSTGTGGNVDNATRQNLRRVLENRMGLSPDEKSALQTAVLGTTGQNIARQLGRFSPSGNGLMQALLVGPAAYGGASGNIPLMAASGLLGAVGMGAKKIADGATARNVAKLEEIIRAGGSRAATKAPDNAIQRLTKTERERLGRAFMSMGLLGAPAFAQQ